ncbi:hypothetical protein CY34DRAFT_809143, partial [Suillus luteus UH-Slu-Lm8-n1]
MIHTVTVTTSRSLSSFPTSQPILRLALLEYHCPFSTPLTSNRVYCAATTLQAQSLRAVHWPAIRISRSWKKKKC